MVNELVWIKIYQLEEDDDLVYYEDMLLELNIPVKMLDCDEALLPKHHRDCGRGPFVYVPKKYELIALEVLDYDKQGILGKPVGFERERIHMDRDYGHLTEADLGEQPKSNYKFMLMVLAAVFVLLFLLRILTSSNILN